jgi:monofunctional biosynthetic peptidoglycan transglycosylase
MRISAIVLMAMSLLFGGAAMADEMSCSTIIEHSEADTDNPWRTVNDGVMGGLSSGGSFLQDDYLAFVGNTNTNGGGFSSVRLPVEPGLMAGSDHLKLWMRPDARRYSVTMRTNVTYRGRPVAFRADVKSGSADEWGEGILDYADLKASIFGRAVYGAEFDPAAVREVSLIIYDGLDGPFRMDLKRIEACTHMNAPTS